MPLYKDTRTGLTTKWTEKHYSKVFDRKYWELVDEEAPAPKPKPKAAKKKAKK